MLLVLAVLGGLRPLGGHSGVAEGPGGNPRGVGGFLGLQGAHTAPFGCGVVAAVTRICGVLGCCVGCCRGLAHRPAQVSCISTEQAPPAAVPGD